MHVLRQEAVPISHSKRVDEYVTGFFTPTDFPQCIHQPKAANQKSRLRQAKIIGCDIPHNVETAAKFTFYGVHCGYKAGIIGGNQPQFGQQ